MPQWLSAGWVDEMAVFQRLLSRTVANLVGTGVGNLLDTLVGNLVGARFSNLMSTIVTTLVIVGVDNLFGGRLAI
jgi:hypothetical protein